MNIEKIINTYGDYGPFFGDGFTNHVPMVQSALYRMAIDEKTIVNVSSYLVDKWALQPFDHYVKVTRLDKHLGDRSSYLGYIDFFKQEVEEKGLEKVIKTSLQTFKTGLSAMLFHGIIRLSYAIENGFEDEIIRALAFYACGFEEIEFKGRSIPLSLVKPEITRFIQSREGYFYLSGEIEDKEAAIVDSLAELYMNTGSFIVLHTITGFQALVSLKRYFKDFSHAIDCFTVCVERSLLRIDQNDYKQIELDTLYSFEELFSYMTDEKDAHTIKLTYSCFRLFETYHNEKLKIVANIRYKERAS